jgi:hypothetical protein
MIGEQERFVIRVERSRRDVPPIVMWLSSTLPERWGERNAALTFLSKGEARRAAADIKLKGAWFDEPAEPR